MNQLQAYLSVNNLYCWTKYSGTDPEVSVAGWGVAVDDSQTPRAKSFTVTLNVGSDKPTTYINIENNEKIYINHIGKPAMVSCVDTVLLPDDKTVDQDFWKTKSDVNQMAGRI